MNAESREITANESLEISLLLEAIHLKYGYDFRNYAKASIKRRINRVLNKLGLENISALQHRILYDPSSFQALLLDLSVNVTEMFRDPSFFRILRKEVLPKLTSQPHIRIWHAGCATGEEVYSMAIILQELGIFEKTQVYATDLNEEVLRKAKDGIFAIDRLKEFTASYQKAGGSESFADYYTASDDSVILNAALRKNVVFAAHNLATDSVFGEMDIIVCRNVLIYFDRTLQDRIFQLFADSLTNGGFLCIGSKESIRFAKNAAQFENFIEGERIYRKLGTADGDG